MTSGRRKLCLTFAVHVLVAMTHARPVHAQTPPTTTFEFLWSAPDACPTRADVIDRIARLLGRAPDSPGGRAFSARADVTSPSPELFRVRVISHAADDVEGERMLEASSCERIADATALVIALAIDPEAVASHSADAAPQPTPPTRAPSLPQRPSPPPRAIAPAPSRTTHGPRLGVRASAALDIGALPAPSPGGAITIALILHRVRVELAGNAWVTQRATGGPHSNSGADISLASGAVRGCFAPLIGTFELAACVATHVGWTWGTGFGVTDPATNGAIWLAFTAGGAVAWSPRSWLSIRLGIEAGPSVIRPEFRFDGFDTLVYKPAVAVGLGEIGVELRFF
jgi:hypothetical protein